MSTILFCPKCGRYIPAQPGCCDWTRPPSSDTVRFVDLKISDNTRIGAQLPCCGQPAIFDKDYTVVPYGAQDGVQGGIAVIHIATNTEAWRCDVAAPVEHLALRDSRVCFTDSRGKAYMVDLRSRQIVASTSIGAPTPAPPLWLADNSILLATRHGQLSRLNNRLNLVQQAKLDGSWRNAHFSSNWALFGADALIGTKSGNVYLFSILQGTLRLLATVEGEVNGIAVSARRDFVVVSTSFGELVTYHVPNWSKPAWTRFSRGTGTYRRINHSVHISGDHLYTASLDHELACLDVRDGAEIWKYEHPYGLVSPVTLGHGLAVVADNRGQLLAVDSASGQKQWIFDAHADHPCEDVKSTVMLGGASPHPTGFVAGSGSGRIYMIEPALDNWNFGKEMALQKGDVIAAAGWLARSNQPNWQIEAAKLLDEHKEHLRAAKIYESLEMLTEQAWQLGRAAMKQPSAFLWQQAMDVWLGINRQAEADECMRRAAIVGRRPLLAFKLDTNSSLRVDEVCEFNIVVRNVTDYLASSVKLILRAPNVSGSEAVFPGRMSNIAEWRESLYLTPSTAGHLPMRIELHYRDENGNEMPVCILKNTLTVAAKLEPPTVIKVDKVICGPYYGEGTVIVN